MVFSLHYHISVDLVRHIAMVFKPILDHLAGNANQAPRPIPDGPKVMAPVFLVKGVELPSKTTKHPSLEPLLKVSQVLGRMTASLAIDYRALKYPQSNRITDLCDKSGQLGYVVPQGVFACLSFDHSRKYVKPEILAPECRVSINYYDP